MPNVILEQKHFERTQFQEPRDRPIALGIDALPYEGDQPLCSRFSHVRYARPTAEGAPQAGPLTGTASTLSFPSRRVEEVSAARANVRI